MKKLIIFLTFTLILINQVIAFEGSSTNYNSRFQINSISIGGEDENSTRIFGGYHPIGTNSQIRVTILEWVDKILAIGEVEEEEEEAPSEGAITEEEFGVEGLEEPKTITITKEEVVKVEPELKLITRIILYSLGAIFLLIIAFITDYLRRDKKISLTLQITFIIFTLLIIIVSILIIQEVLREGSFELSNWISIIGIIAIVILILGFITDYLRKKP